MNNIVQSLNKRGNPLEIGNSFPCLRLNHLADYGSAIFAAHRGKIERVLGHLDNFHGKFGSFAFGAFWFHFGPPERRVSPAYAG
jgi:hypothetical protein